MNLIDTPTRNRPFGGSTLAELLFVRHSVWAASVCGVCGVALIQAPYFDAGAKAASAVALSLTAALTSAVAMLGLHRLKGLDPWTVVVHYSGTATLFVLASWTIGRPPNLDGLAEKKTLLLFLGVGVAATLGQLCITRAFTSGQPMHISVVGLMQVVFALGLDVLFVGPNVQLVTLAGIGLVLAPTAWMMMDKSYQASQAVGREHLTSRSKRQQGPAENVVPSCQIWEPSAVIPGRSSRLGSMR
jgi:drug/metabolite transporter (DMT)-like permease